MIPDGGAVVCSDCGGDVLIEAEFSGANIDLFDARLYLECSGCGESGTYHLEGQP